MTEPSSSEKDTSERKFPQDQFRLLAENIPCVIYLCRNDENLSIIYVNDRIEALTGYRRKDFMSGVRDYVDLLHPDDVRRRKEELQNNVAERKTYHLQYRLQHLTGEWRWVDETGVALYDGDKAIMFEGFVQDVTSQKESEETFLEVAEQNLRFFNNPVNLNSIVDFNGNLIRNSPSWELTLGWTDEEIRTRSVFDLVHPDDRQRAQEHLAKMSTTRSLHTFEHRLMCKDGSFRWLLWALAPDPVARVVYASAIDISERKRSEKNILDSKSSLESVAQQLQLQNRKLDEFAHIISHNLRAPVSNIQALINLLNDSSEITDYKLIFEKLRNVAKNLSETMNELMDTLKARTPANVVLTDVRFKEVLDKVVQSLEGELIMAQASVTFDFNDAPSIRYSKPYLESIFQNLLSNAVKYKSPDRAPSVHFRTRREGNDLILEVKDNGQGIDLKKFGDKLFGLHKTFHDHQEARGVGLFLVKSQIEAMGGTISVDSEVDKGTTFTIRIVVE